ncbi:MAG: RDD family protein, partial [Actinomycetota bacterium]
MPFPRALLRNALKIAVPWMLGHAVVFELVQTSEAEASAVPGWLWVVTAGAYVLPAAYVVSLFVRR